MASAGRATSTASAATIGIAPFGPAALSADLRTRLEEAATAGLLATGASVATRESVARAASAMGLAACAEPSCLERLAGPAGARLWLRGTCLVEGSTYRTHLELFDVTGSPTGSPINSVTRPSAATTQAGPGAVVAARDDTCEICTEAEAAEMTNVAASALRAAWKRSTPQAAPPPLVLGHGSGPAGTAAAGSRVTRISVTTGPTAEPPSQQRSTWRRAWPVALLVAGAAALGGGIYLIHEDGLPTDYRTTSGGELPASLYDTKGLAIASFASAGVLIGAAAVLFAVGPSP
jgi:hypothetical protein